MAEVTTNANAAQETASLSVIAEAALLWARAERARMESIAPGVSQESIQSRYTAERRARFHLYSLCQEQIQNQPVDRRPTIDPDLPVRQEDLHPPL